jgi:hypothetical protein
MRDLGQVADGRELVEVANGVQWRGAGEAVAGLDLGRAVVREQG